MTEEEDRPGPQLPRFIYLDTCIVSYLAGSEIDDFVPLFKAKGYEPVVSDLTLSELSRGSGQDKLSFLERHEFWKVLASEPLWVDGKTSFFKIDPLQETYSQPHPIEVFLQNFLRFTSGSASVVDLGQSFQQVMLDTLEELKKEFPTDSDPRLQDLLHSNIDAASKAIAQTPKLPSVPGLKSTLQSQRIGPKFLVTLRRQKSLKKWNEGFQKNTRQRLQTRFDQSCLQTTSERA